MNGRTFNFWPASWLTLFIWTLVLLLLTNVGWACWLAYRMDFWADFQAEKFEKTGRTTYENGCERTVSICASPTIAMYFIYDEDPNNIIYHLDLARRIDGHHRSRGWKRRFEAGTSPRSRTHGAPSR